MRVLFFKNDRPGGNGEGAIQTSETDYVNFIRETATELSAMIEGGRFDGDWNHIIEQWLPQIVEISCRLKGYKAEVSEQTVITAGSFSIDMAPLNGDKPSKALNDGG